MRIWLVPSHHDMSAKPETMLGIELDPCMLSRGIWHQTGGRSLANLGQPNKPDTIQREIVLERSKLEATYLDAFAALKEVGGRDEHGMCAVVAMMWCPLLGSLICSKRTWLTIYQGTTEILVMSHEDGDRSQGRPVYTFVHVYQPAPKNALEWKQLFEEKMKLGAA